MEIDTEGIRKALEPRVKRETLITVTPNPNIIKRMAPNTKLGKRIRTATEIIEVLVTLDFRLEIPNIKDIEIENLKRLLKEKQDLVIELLEENRKLRGKLEEKEKEKENTTTIKKIIYA